MVYVPRKFKMILIAWVAFFKILFQEHIYNHLLLYFIHCHSMRLAAQLFVGTHPLCCHKEIY